MTNISSKDGGSLSPGEVDVIVLSWNRVDDTIAAIASAAGQKNVEARVLVVDQGSEPENLRRLKGYLRPLQNVQLKLLQHNAGVAGGRNIATAMGASPYVVALDSDAVFARDDVLARVVAHLRRHDDLGAIGFRITNYFTGDNDATSWDYPAGRSPQRRFPCSRFIGAGHAIRRRAFERAGGYDERLFFCGEELDLSYRILNAGYRIEYFPEAEILHKVSPEHRVYWGRGRYFYTVRNNLYSAYKFHTPPSRLLVAAAAFLLKGVINGIPGEALRGVRDAVRMSAAFDRNAAEHAIYRLAPDTWSRIRELEPWRDEAISSKIQRQFRRLPNQA